MRKRILLVCLALLSVLVACKTTARQEQRKTDKLREANLRQERQERRKAIRAHLNNQDQGTKRRIKKTVRKQRQHYRANAPKGKDSTPCPK